MPSSWFSLSLPNPFNSDDDKSPPHSPTAIVKPDFSLITQTIGRKLQNVASFLAPPPLPLTTSTPPLDSVDSGDASPSSTSSYKGIKNDLAEISGSFRTGLSLLSSNKAVSEISKFASNLLQFDKRDNLEEFEDAGITDEVIDFVREISHRPEYWIDFPLSLHHKDFNMSHLQKDHASAMEQLVPSLATLRHTIHNYMNEQQFWMIYFILLLPRLNDDDNALLSTPEIVDVREVLLQNLRNKKNTPVEFSDDENPREPENRSLSEKVSHVGSTEGVQNPFKAFESSRKTSSNATNGIKTDTHEDDVSFSDLEDEDNDLSVRLSGRRQTQSSRLSSASEASDWVRLNESCCEQKARQPTYRDRHSESEESSDWLAVEDGDL